MPPLPRLKLPILQELERELRYAPPEALRRDIARVEGLMSDLDAATTYPDEWVVFRVTGYRREHMGGGMSAGRTLLADLSVFLERLCDAAGLTIAEHEAMGKDVLSVDQLCVEWSVSRKTLDRWRRQGLAARRVRDAQSRSRLLFTRVHVEAFAARHSDELRHAAAFSRMDEATERRVLAQAARYRRCLGMSLNAAAERLAERHGRSHETIRQVLRKHEEAEGVIKPPPPINSRRREVIYRSWRLGIDPVAMSKKYGRTTSAIRRAILLARAHRLRDLAERDELSAPVGPTFRRVDAPDVLLASVPVRSGLAQPAPIDLLDLITFARQRQPAIGVEERSRLIAYHYLRWTAGNSIRELNRLHPAAEIVDRVETDLRWAARLKAELIRPQLFLIVETLELRLEQRLTELSPVLAMAHLRRALARATGAIDTVDPFKNARVAAAVGLEVDRGIAAWLKAHPAVRASERRASPILVRGTPFPDWTRTVASWQSWLEPDARVRAGASAAAMPTIEGRFLGRRFGWDGGPPATLHALSKEFEIAPTVVGRFERRAIRTACTMGL